MLKEMCEIQLGHCNVSFLYKGTMIRNVTYEKYP